MKISEHTTNVVLLVFVHSDVKKQITDLGTTLETSI